MRTGISPAADEALNSWCDQKVNKLTYQPPPNGFRTFVILWASQSVSVLGTEITLFALNVWLVTVAFPRPEQQPQLAWALAAVGMAMGVAGLITTPFAGALADRLDRKRLMLAMDLVNGARMATIALLAALGRLEVWMVVLAAGLTGITDAVHNSAFDTSYAMLVPDEQLPRATGMMETIWSLSGVLSPALAASIIALPALARAGALPPALGSVLGRLENGVPLAFGLDAASFLLAATVLALLHIPSPRDVRQAGSSGPVASLWADVRFGVEYIRRRPPLAWLLATFAVVNLCLPLGVFVPLIVKVELAADWMARGMTYEAALAALNTTMALGGLAGGILVSLSGGARRRRVVVLLLSILLGGIAQMGLGLAPGLYLAGAAAFFVSFVGPLANAHSQAIWQGQVERGYQGRVFAVRRVIAWSLTPLGQVIAGWLAARVDPGLGLALLGGVIVLVTGAQFFNRHVMRVEDKACVEGLAGGAQA